MNASQVRLQSGPRAIGIAAAAFAHLGLLAGVEEILSSRSVDRPPVPAGFRLVSVPIDRPHEDSHPALPVLASTAITLAPPALPDIRIEEAPPSIVQPACPPPDPDHPRERTCDPVLGLPALNGQLRWDTEEKAATEEAAAANLKRLADRFGEPQAAPPPAYDRDILPETAGRPWQKLEKWQEENLQYSVFLGR